MMGGLLAACILCSGIWGWYTGALKVSLKLGVLALAYGLTWQLTPTLANHMATQGWLKGVYVWPSAAVVLFVGSMLLFSLTARFCLYLAPDEWHHSGKPAGALAGLVLGAVVGFSLVWTVGVLQDAYRHRQQATAPPPNTDQPSSHTAAPPPSTSPTAVAARTPLDQALYDFTANVMANAVTSALPDSPGTNLAQAMLKSPIAVGEGFKQLANSAALRQLLTDPASRQLLVQGDVARIRQLPAFRELTSNTALMEFLKTGGLTGDTDSQREQDLAAKLARYTRNFEIIRQTPAYQAIQQDQDFQAKLHAGQWLELLGDERIRHLTELLINPPEDLAAQLSATDPLSTPTTYSISAPGDTQWQSSSTAPPTAPPDNEADDTANPPASLAPIYRWRDNNGNIHLTDKKPPDGTDYDTLVR